MSISTGPTAGATETTTGGGRVSEALMAKLNRQMAAMDTETQAKILSSGVLIVDGEGESACPGLFAELAKNLILMGVSRVTLCDPSPVTIADLSSHFFLTEADVGSPRRDQAALPRFLDLRLSVYSTVSCLATPCISPTDVSSHAAVVLCGGTLQQSLSLNALCRASPTGTKYIWADSRGVQAMLFNDLGDSFTVRDSNGEPARTWMVTNVTQDSNGAVVSLVDEPGAPRFDLEPDSLVCFNGFDGMKELNGTQQRVKQTSGRSEFVIDTDSSHFSLFGRAGYVTEIKQPVAIHFDSLQSSLASSKSVEIMPFDFGKPDRQYLLMLCYRALWQFMETHHGQLPRPHNPSDASEILSTVQSFNSTVHIDEQVVKKFSFVAAGHVSPMDTFVGGVACQEVLKACTGKFMPFRPWFFFDAQESLPASTTTDYCPETSRYDGQIVVYGKALQRRVESLKYFAVGAGAIGCELLKVWAMMGVGCGVDGMIHVTDMDNIEPSNLSRQFLFHEQDVNKPKSQVAAEAVKRMNPAVHVTTYTLRVGKESEEIFSEEFYQALDGVCTALDNIPARKYIDEQCVMYRKVMIDSGTLGAQGSTQVIVPHLTENYNNGSSDSVERGIPSCSLHNFPNAIEHCIQWARDNFDGFFTIPIAALKAYLESPQKFFHSIPTSPEKCATLQRLLADLMGDRPMNFVDCICWARVKFEELFANKINTLLHHCPPDYKTVQGLPFWHAPKKCPHPLVFDPANKQHLAFIESAANLRAFNYGITPTATATTTTQLTADLLATALQSCHLPVFVLPSESSAGQEIPTDVSPAPQNTESSPNGAEEEEKRALELFHSLPDVKSLMGIEARPAEFEKDHDENYHIAFITACSNLRAENYEIPAVDFQRTKIIAGKIIPAMISTTAVVAGLQCLELIKTLQSDTKQLSDYRCSFLNLAIPFFSPSEPREPSRTRIRHDGWSFTIWDYLDLPGHWTLAEVIQHFAEKFQLKLTLVSFGGGLIPLVPGNMGRSMKVILGEVFEQLCGEPLPVEFKEIPLEITCVRLEDNVELCTTLRQLPSVRCIMS